MGSPGGGLTSSAPIQLVQSSAYVTAMKRASAAPAPPLVSTVVEDEAPLSRHLPNPKNRLTSSPVPSPQHTRSRPRSFFQC